ncbi:MAG: hypothetical protein AAF662_00145 [Pseudomonadota bacterium]
MSRKDCLRQVIAKYLNADIRRMVVPGALEDVLPDGTTLEGLIEKRIHEADQSFSLPNLCEEMKQKNPNPAFHNELDACMGVGMSAGTLTGVGSRPRWYDEQLPMRRPLFDRDELRAGLYDMLERDPVNTRLMTVRGEAPGKSYCACLIKHVIGELGLEQPVEIDLLSIDSVDRLATRLIDLLGLSHAQLRDRFSTEVREGKYFNDWLVGQSRSFAADKRWVIVFDHLAKTAVPQDVANTVIDLALRAEDRSLTNVWIILLDSPESDALIDANPPVEEVVSPIQQATIQAFLARLVDLRRAAGDPNPEVPDPISATLQEPFPLATNRLQSLRRDIVRWMRTGP